MWLNWSVATINATLQLLNIYIDYTYFYTFFYLHVFLKNINNVTRTTLPNSFLKREWRQTKEKRKEKKKKEEEEGGDISAEDLAWPETTVEDEGTTSDFYGQPVASSTWCSPCLVVRGVARNFGLGGPNYIFIYTYIYTTINIYIYILEIIIFINFNEYKQIVYFAINMYKNVLPLFNCNFF